MSKIYVLDTNVLLQSAESVYAFGEHTVVIPEIVLEELDRFKKESGELGANAREVARTLDLLREKGKLTEGVALPNGGRLIIESNHRKEPLPAGWSKESADNRILQVCKGLAKHHDPVYLVTKDVFQRIKADILEIVAQDFRREQAPAVPDQYQGRAEVYAPGKEIQAFYKRRKPILKEHLRQYCDNGEPVAPVLVPNQFLVIRSEDGAGSALGRFDGQKALPLFYTDETPSGVKPRNVGQKFYQEALLMPARECPLVIVKGPAGTAKTFLALAAGLENVVERKEYRRILVCRSNVTMDEEIGFLPGTEQDKLGPLIRGVKDNLEIIHGIGGGYSKIGKREQESIIDYYFSTGLISTEAVAYLRGRSIMRQWIIVDEAQNLTPKQVKAIITRVGEDTKLILAGDPAQIDHPYLDSRTNGLCYAAERMKGSRYCCQVTLTDNECERSALATEAAMQM
ncbi:MAG: PhoH family protein [Solirubrobacterales bacterium]